MRRELDRHEADLTDLDAYGSAQARFEALGGWALEARLDEARRRLDIDAPRPRDAARVAVRR